MVTMMDEAMDQRNPLVEEALSVFVGQRSGGALC